MGEEGGEVDGARQDGTGILVRQQAAPRRLLPLLRLRRRTRV